MQSRDELIEKLVEHMALVQRHMRVRRSSAWLDLDLTRQQAKTLHFLTDGQRRMSEIAGRLDVEMPSATSMIDRLVARGWSNAGRTPRTGAPWSARSRRKALIRSSDSQPSGRRGPSRSPLY